MTIEKFKRFAVLLFLFVGLLHLTSCTPKPDDNPIQFSISYLRDGLQKETIKTIEHQKFLKLESPNLGFKNGVYWFKVQINDSIQANKLVFNLTRNNIDDIVIYNDQKEVAFVLLEKTTPSLLIKPQKNNTYFLKVRFDKQVFFDLKIDTFQIAQLNSKLNFLKNGTYYGLVLMVLIINLFFFVSFKDKSYLYYSFFLSSIAIGFSTFDGFINLVFTKEIFYYFDKSIHFSVALFGVLFANHFLNLKYYHPKSYLIGRSLLFLFALCYVQFYITKNNFFISLGDNLGATTLSYDWFLGVAVFKKHNFAKFFVLGYSLILLYLVFFILPTNWGFYMPYVSVKSLKIASIFEMIILTYAITFRTKMLLIENKKYRSEIKNYLEKLNKVYKSSNSNLEEDKEKIKQKFNLSEREMEVLLLIEKGYTNKIISDKLLISINTTKFHIRNIYEKLNINSKNEVIDLFLEIKNPKQNA